MASDDRLEQLWAEVLKARERANAAFRDEDALRLQMNDIEARHNEALKELRAARDQFTQARTSLNRALEPS